MDIAQALGSATAVLQQLGLIPIIQAFFVISLAGAAVALIRRLRE